MAQRELLDCTLRDGGYVNDWEFGHKNIVSIFQRLVSSKVEYIEVGFLDERRPFDINRTIMPDAESVNRIFAGLDKGESQVLAMIDYGTCGINKIQPAAESFLDGIRVIFKEHLMYEALDFCRQVKELGYKVFAQMVSVTTYTDEKLEEYSKLVNAVMPYATSMVDTYGLLEEEQLLHIYGILDKHLDRKVKVGFHAHNNFQLGFANAKALLVCNTKRDILVDGTLYGMGKSAGNAPLELLMMYMNQKMGRNYEVSQALEAIDSEIMDIYQKQYWGYNLFFYISAACHCHPNYVSYLMNKRTLSVRQIRDILSNLEPGKDLLYDAKYAEEVYVKYQDIHCDDKNAITSLKKKFNNREILLVGPGNSMSRQKAKVEAFIAEKKPLVVAVNYAPKKIKADYIFLSNAKRYTELMNDMSGTESKDAQIIATSNVTKAADDFNYILKYGTLIDLDTEIIDNSLVMLIKAMARIGIKKVNLAGFDGYSKRADNYFDVSREYTFAKEKADYLNNYVSGFISEMGKRLKVSFITKSRYAK